MKDYTSTEPIFSESIPVVEEDDLVNAENNNAAAKQLLQNLLVLRSIMVIKEEGKSLVSDAERNLWNMIYQQATGYTDQKIADLIGGAPSTLDTLGEIAKAMADNADVVEALNAAIGTKATQAEVESLLGTKLDKTGDTKDNTTTFTSSDTTTPSGWTEVAVLKSGENHKSFLQKASTMFKNVRYLWKLCGSNDISKLGDGTITGAIASLNTDLTWKAYASGITNQGSVNLNDLFGTYNSSRQIHIIVKAILSSGDEYTIAKTMLLSDINIGASANRRIILYIGGGYHSALINAYCAVIIDNYQLYLNAYTINGEDHRADAKMWVLYR